MLPLKKRTQDLESTLQSGLIRELLADGWYCRSTHGNAYQSGFPDVFACKRNYGVRWIEVKRPTGYKFTQAQHRVFKAFSSKNIGIWVLTSKELHERNKLYGPSNWYHYLNTSRGITLKEEIKRIPKRGPEAEIQDAIIAKLTTVCGCENAAECQKHPLNNWYCLETYGSSYQSGFPDIYCCHKRYGFRWIECKNPKSYSFTSKQLEVFPCFAAHCVNIYVLVDSSDYELTKMFGPSNFHTYMWK